jgi:hypothetical protein
LRPAVARHFGGHDNEVADNQGHLASATVGMALPEPSRFSAGPGNETRVEALFPGWQAYSAMRRAAGIQTGHI